MRLGYWRGVWVQPGKGYPHADEERGDGRER